MYYDKCSQYLHVSAHDKWGNFSKGAVVVERPLQLHSDVILPLRGVSVL